MKRLCAVALVAGSLFAQEPKPIENPTQREKDVEFALLGAWSQDLDKRINEWNDKCGDNISPNEACDLVQKRLDVEMTAFLQVGKEYKAPGGECVDRMKEKLVERICDLYKWNLDCGGLRLTQQCIERSESLGKAGDKLKEEIDTCLSKANSL
jgi:hypothetical protein